MRSCDHQVRRHVDVDWHFCPNENALEATDPSTRQRTAAAIAGVICAIVLFCWAVPPAQRLKPGDATEHAQYPQYPQYDSLTRVVPNALRALTGLAAPVPADSRDRRNAAPSAGIRN